MDWLVYWFMFLLLSTHTYDYTAFFVAIFDIPVRFGGLFQWIKSIDERLELTILDQLFDRI
jgi:hypothetical protein